MPEAHPQQGVHQHFKDEQRNSNSCYHDVLLTSRTGSSSQSKDRHAFLNSPLTGGSHLSERCRTAVLADGCAHSGRHTCSEQEQYRRDREEQWRAVYGYSPEKIRRK
jgi:hypothetical protein